MDLNNVEYKNKCSVLIEMIDKLDSEYNKEIIKDNLIKINDYIKDFIETYGLEANVYELFFYEPNSQENITSNVNVNQHLKKTVNLNLLEYILYKPMSLNHISCLHIDDLKIIEKYDDEKIKIFKDKILINYFNELENKNKFNSIPVKFLKEIFNLKISFNLNEVFKETGVPLYFIYLRKNNNLNILKKLEEVGFDKNIKDENGLDFICYSSVKNPKIMKHILKNYKNNILENIKKTDINKNSNSIHDFFNIMSNTKFNLDEINEFIIDLNEKDKYMFIDFYLKASFNNHSHYSVEDRIKKNNNNDFLIFLSQLNTKYLLENEYISNYYLRTLINNICEQNINIDKNNSDYINLINLIEKIVDLNSEKVMYNKTSIVSLYNSIKNIEDKDFAEICLQKIMMIIDKGLKDEVKINVLKEILNLNDCLYPNNFNIKILTKHHEIVLKNFKDLIEKNKDELKSSFLNVNETFLKNSFDIKKLDVLNGKMVGVNDFNYFELFNIFNKYIDININDKQNNIDNKTILAEYLYNNYNKIIELSFLLDKNNSLTSHLKNHLEKHSIKQLNDKEIYENISNLLQPNKNVNINNLFTSMISITNDYFSKNLYDSDEDDDNYIKKNSKVENKYELKQIYSNIQMIILNKVDFEFFKDNINEFSKSLKSTFTFEDFNNMIRSLKEIYNQKILNNDNEAINLLNKIKICENAFYNKGKVKQKNNFRGI